MEAAFIASDLALAIRAMFYLTIFSIALAVVFAALYLSFRPRLRRAIRTNGKLLDRIERLKLTQIEGSARNLHLVEKVDELEKVSTQLVTEVQRVDAIRKRTDGHCVALRQENDLMRRMIEHVDFTEEEGNDPRTTSPAWFSESDITALAGTGVAANEPLRAGEESH